MIIFITFAKKFSLSNKVNIYLMTLIHELQAQGNFFFRYRSYLPILLIPLAFIVMYHNAQTDKLFYNTKVFTIYELLCISLSIFGLIIRSYTVGYTPKNTSGRNTSEGQVADTLNTTSIYSLVRHPLYIGNFFMWLGVCVLTQDVAFTIIFTLLYVLYYERIMMAEEKFLSDKFGQPFEKWSKITPAIFPNFKNWVQPNLSFSWKKVLKKEKNGLFAIFILIFVFNCFTNWVQTGTFWTEKLWSIYMMGITGVVYIILKYFKTYTNILSEEN